MEELIFLFIPKNLFFQGAKPSKVALPCSKQLLKKVKCKGRNQELLKRAVCVLRGELYPLFIQGSKVVRRRYLAGTPVSTASAFHPDTAIRSCGWEAPGGVRLHPGCGRTLTDFVHHCLCMMDRWVDLGCSLGVFSPKWFAWMGLLLYFICTIQRYALSEAPFWYIF